MPTFINCPRSFIIKIVRVHVHSTVDQRTCIKMRWRNGKFYVDTMVRGYHEYQDIWTAASGEKLKCAHEIGNYSDLFAVAVVKNKKIIGHLT